MSSSVVLHVATCVCVLYVRVPTVSGFERRERVQVVRAVVPGKMGERPMCCQTSPNSFKQPVDCPFVGPT